MAKGVDLSKVDENDKSDVIMARNFVISKIWKNMNERKSHPLCGRIIVPVRPKKRHVPHLFRADMRLPWSEQNHLDSRLPQGNRNMGGGHGIL